MKKFNKNIVLVILTFLNQIHILFKGSGIKLVWLINDVTKSLNLSVFLFVKHLTIFILLFITLKPKGYDKNLILFLVIASFLDLFFFVLNSNSNVVVYKFVISGLIFFFLKSKFNKWVKY